MPVLVASNAFTAQGSTVMPSQGNPSPNGSYGYRTFGTKCVLATNIDKVVLTCADGSENGGYTNSTWHYDIDNRWFQRTRPDPSNLATFGAFPATPDGFIDRDSGPARGDNRQLVYHPSTGKVWEWGGNAGDNTPLATRQDPTWFGHIFPPSGGVYLYDPVTHLWTMPSTTGYANRYLSSGCGWDPNINRFLQVMGERDASFETSPPARLYEIDPSTGPGGTMANTLNWDWTLGQGPQSRVNISHQFVYHTRARRWILFGGNVTGYSTVFNDTWLYDAVTRRWTNLRPTGTPEARGFALMWYDTQNNVVILTGGSAGDPTTGPKVTSTWAYSLEYNTWTNLGIPFSRSGGGVVYDPTRNLAVLTPGSGLSDTDVYTFRYAIPRITLTTDTWKALPIGSPTVYMWPEKHMSACYCPLTKRIYTHGGDTLLHFLGSDGIDVGGQSYYQRDFSLDLAQRFAAPTTVDAGAREEVGFCVTGSLVRPKHPDFVGWTWDSKRNVFYHVPGKGESASGAGVPPFNCAGETSVSSDGTPNSGDDPNYLSAHIMSFNPLNPAAAYADVSNQPNVPHPATAWPWHAWYDPVTDVILRFTQLNNQTDFRDERFSPATLSWTNTNLAYSNFAFYDLTAFPWDVDPQRRQVYFAERQIFNTLSRYDIDTKTLTVLGALPGSGALTAGIISDKGNLVFDWNARVLIYTELIAPGSPSKVYRVWRTSPDTLPLVWTDITTLPTSTLDGSAFVGPSAPSCYGGGCFEPDNNVVMLWGSENSNRYYWVLRNIDMGVSAPASINPVPVLTSISPATCTTGQTLTVTALGTGASFVSTSLILWDGVSQPTTFLDSTHLSFQVTAAMSATVGNHTVSVFSPTPGGGTSALTVFTVTAAGNPVPVISSLSPAQTPQNSALTVTVTGTNFVASSVVNWDGAAQPTTYVSTTQLAVNVTGAMASVLGAHSVTVFNPAPDGGTSNSLTFTVSPILPQTQAGVFVSVIM